MSRISVTNNLNNPHDIGFSLAKSELRVIEEIVDLNLTSLQAN